MGNQQPRSLDDRIRVLAKNAKIGDGTIWKHPECKNAKVVYTSTTPELLEVKMAICPEIFKTGVKYQDMSKHASSRFPNAKPLYRLASVVNPIITEYKAKNKWEVIPELTSEDLGLWYLDDGSTIIRNDSDYGYIRSFLYIGGICPTDETTELFRKRLSELFEVSVSDIGAINRHTPFDSDLNKVWHIPVAIAKTIMQEASKYNVLPHKFPHKG